MATPISYGIGISDQNLQAMLNSDTPEIRQQAEEYIRQAEEQQQDNSGFLQKVKDFFSMGTAAGAEPDFNVITGEPNITTNQFPFRSMADMAAANDLALSQIYSTPLQSNYGNTQSGFATNFPFAQNVDRGIPTIDLSGLPVNMGVANEPDVPQVPLSNTGIPFATKAKNFITQTLPNMIKGGINMIPGMRFIQSLDRFNTLPYQDRQFIKSRMTGDVSGIYVDPNTGLLKDQTGKNVRSLLGNYAERVDKEYDRYEKAIERAEKKYGVTWDGSKFVGTNSDTANYMNKFNINAFNFYKQQKDDKQAQQRNLLDKIAAQVKSGATAKIGQALHGGEGPKGGGPDYSNVSTGGGGSPAQQAATRSRDLRGGPGKNYGPYR